MGQAVLFSIIESPIHPDYSGLYRELKIQDVRLLSMRKALTLLKKQQPDFIVAEFFYGYGNNYAGVNISNLDVLLSSLQKYAPTAKVIVLVEKAEAQYVPKLNALFPLHAVLQYPVSSQSLKDALRK